MIKVLQGLAIIAFAAALLFVINVLMKLMYIFLLPLKKYQLYSLINFAGIILSMAIPVVSFGAIIYYSDKKWGIFSKKKK